MTSSTNGRRAGGLVALLTGIGLVVAARAAVGQPAHGQAALPPLPPLQTATPPPPPATGSPAGSTSAGATSKAAAPRPTGPRTVNGDVVDTPYGPVQVAVVFSGTRIVDVRTLRTPSDAYRSVGIAAQATPILRQEMLTAQSARVDMVSGATYTSGGYLQSAQYAIDHANG
jgi:uncharacterized protein with FMN-binding domain